MSLGHTDRRVLPLGSTRALRARLQQLWRAQVSQPCAPTSSALPKPMEGALWSGAVAARPAGAAGVKAAGFIMASISEGQRKAMDLKAK